MAVRLGPGAGQSAVPTTGGGGAQVPGQAAQVLQQMGIIKPGMTVKQITESLVNALAAKGFGGSLLDGLGTQLGQALAAFQRANGLPVTGQLDVATANLLQQMGLLPQGGGASSAGIVNVKDGFEGGAVQQPVAKAGADGKTTTSAKGEAQTQAQNQTPQQVLANVVRAAIEGSQKAMEFLTGLLGLGGAGAGAVPEGGAQAAPQGQPAQDASAASTSAAANAGAAAKAEGGDNKNARTDGSGLAREVAGGSKSLGDEKVRGKKGLKDARERGVEDIGDEDEGQGDDGGRGSSSGDGEGGGAEDGAHDKGAAEGDADGSERWTGNATSGDDDRDRPRGHAQLPEDWLVKPGYYRAPAVADQWRRALREIRRDDDTGDNRTTTYTWDVVFYTPGVYGPGQQAEELLHLVVREATAFDRAWARAVDSLEAVVLQIDGADADMPIREDVLRAIRQARVRG